MEHRFRAAEHRFRAVEHRFRAAEHRFRATEPVERAAEPRFRATEPVERAAEHRFRATEPVERAAEHRFRATEPVERAADPRFRAAKPDAGAKLLHYCGESVQALECAMPEEPSEPARTGGYVTDVPYPRSFVPQIAPATLRLVAALNGHPTPPEDDFDYCELGSAQADTLLTLAAANPGARFVGVELSPEQVATARERAKRGEVSNVRFLECDFEDLARQDIPKLDFIVAHGIWSWVSARKRDAVLAFVAASLKPGGLFYVSYNALPGWAAIEPLRRLMLDYTSNKASTVERAREGMQLAQRLADAGASYFGHHPTARSMLALMQKGGLPYVAHEYFHADWQSMYVADVARALAARGLRFLGQLPLYANVRELAIPPSLKKTAETVTDRIALEGLKDYATNELFRSDVYVKGKLERSVSESRYYFEGTPFGTLAPLAQMKREARFPFYTLDYKDPIYEGILKVVAERATTGMELALVPELAQAGQLRLGDCLQNLTLGGQVVPMRPPSPETVAPSTPTTRFRLATKYNELVLADALLDAGPLVLASPAMRGGVYVTILEALCIRLVTDESATPASYGDRVRDFARTRAMPLVVGDRKIKDGDELAKVMAREIERFTVGVLPKLVELGILVARRGAPA